LPEREGYDPARLYEVRKRARLILRRGLGEPIGTEEGHADAVRRFDEAFPADDWRRDEIVALLKRPMAAPTQKHGSTELPPARLRLPCSVYVIGFDKYVKIGITQRDVQYRIAGIQTGCPEKLEIYAVLPGDLFLERSLHERFASLRRNGEWFLREGALAEWIAGGCKEAGG
jgi:hypothetical protein